MRYVGPHYGWQRFNSSRFYGNHVIEILQRALDEQERLMDQNETVAVE